MEVVCTDCYGTLSHKECSARTAQAERCGEALEAMEAAILDVFAEGATYVEVFNSFAQTVRVNISNISETLEPEARAAFMFKFKNSFDGLDAMASYLDREVGKVQL
jgi:gamma-glutamylcyclotransferase (GGCT)/AIG2-like uncharacterized protein YtfP